MLGRVRARAERGPRDGRYGRKGAGESVVAAFLGEGFEVRELPLLHESVGEPGVLPVISHHDQASHAWLRAAGAPHQPPQGAHGPHEQRQKGQEAAAFIADFADAAYSVTKYFSVSPVVVLSALLKGISICVRLADALFSSKYAITWYTDYARSKGTMQDVTDLSFQQTTPLAYLPTDLSAELWLDPSQADADFSYQGNGAGLEFNPTTQHIKKCLHYLL